MYKTCPTLFLLPKKVENIGGGKKTQKPIPFEFHEIERVEMSEVSEVEESLIDLPIPNI